MTVHEPIIDDIFAEVDAAEATDEDGHDVVANSCDEDDESDLDSPKALPPPTQAVTPVPTSSRFKGLVASSHLTPVRQPLSPIATMRSGGVLASARRGGRMVYETSKPAVDAYYFMVQWRKPQQKKHKTWDGDAYLKVEGSKMLLISEEAKTLGTTNFNGGQLGSGSELRIGGLDCEVDRAVTYEEFKRATSCLNGAPPPTASVPAASFASPAVRTPIHTGYAKPFKTPTILHPRAAASSINRPFTPVIPSQVAGPSTAAAPPASTGVSAASFYAKPKPPSRVVVGDKRSRKEREQWGGALHDPEAEGAVVMPRPAETEATRRQTEIVDVVVDPYLAERMRDHQKEGVKFMYRCVMGMSGSGGNGCILADEMGLGKTLTTIALINTLTKQSPFMNESSVIGRALIVCPVSLVSNWKQEFRKWLPRTIVQAVTDNDESKVRAFTHNRSIQVLIIGYERLVKVVKILKSCQPPVGLIVCDEGHRLKSKDNKTTKVFDELNAKRRIILTGTPVQNDLGEFWAMTDFVCPGIFGQYSSFARQYEKPILKARAVNCSTKDMAKGKECSAELRELANEFLLRRDSSVLKNYLPPKTEYVVFVAPSATQLDTFSRLIGTSTRERLLNGMSSAQLAMIDQLRKVANSPVLLGNKVDGDADEVASFIGNIATVQKGAVDVSISGKLMLLERMLKSVYETMEEKIVVVSNWTSTLNLIQDLCIKKRYSFLRLDGSTAQKQRQSLVNDFNRGPRSQSMVFLLSAKAGGVGLNLIGASRLVLFDSDWNPAVDLQAMARIHRDGQRKPVFIYRLLTANTIDEKVYQRQLTKTGLSDEMMGGQGGVANDTKDSFSHQELRDIFTLNVYTDGCQTHDLLGCDCDGQPQTTVDTPTSIQELGDGGSDSDEDMGFVTASQYDPEPTPKQRMKTEQAQQAKLAALKKWLHVDAFKKDSVKNINDTLLYNIMRDDITKHGGDKSTVRATTSRSTARSETPEARPMKKAKTTRRRIPDSDDDASVAFDSGADDSDDEIIDLTSIAASRKRTRARVAESLSPVKHAEQANVVPEKTHNLRELADANQAGRITFVFEKVSKSQL